MSKYFQTSNLTLYNGDALSVLQSLPDETIDCVVTSPPYYCLRNYSDQTVCKWPDGWIGQLGTEPTFDLYIEHLTDIFREIKRVLKPTGTIWINIGDTYAGSGNGTNNYSTEQSKSLSGKRFQYNNKFQLKQDFKSIPIQRKSMCNIPARFAISMTDKLQLIQRNEIIWYRENAMPEPINDRYIKSYEKIYLFTKQTKYYFEKQVEPAISHENRPHGVVRERIYNYSSKTNKLRGYKNKSGSTGLPEQHHGKNIKYGEFRTQRDVWIVNTHPFSSKKLGLDIEHFAVFPIDIPLRCIKAGCPENGYVLDPFAGSGTTAIAALQLGKRAVLIEPNRDYCKLIQRRVESEVGLFL